MKEEYQEKLIDKLTLIFYVLCVIAGILIGK